MINKIFFWLSTCLLIMATGVAYAGNTRTFWTEVPDASITTSVNVVNYDASAMATMTTSRARCCGPLCKGRGYP